MVTKRTKEMENQAILFIIAYKEAEGISPTVREIGEHLGLASPASSHRILRELMNEGRITMKKGCPRSISITGRKDSV